MKHQVITVVGLCLTVALLGVGILLLTSIIGFGCDLLSTLY